MMNFREMNVFSHYIHSIKKRYSFCYFNTALAFTFRIDYCCTRMRLKMLICDLYYKIYHLGHKNCHFQHQILRNRLLPKSVCIPQTKLLKESLLVLIRRLFAYFCITQQDRNIFIAYKRFFV